MFDEHKDFLEQELMGMLRSEPVSSDEFYIKKSDVERLGLMIRDDVLNDTSSSLYESLVYVFTEYLKDRSSDDLSLALDFCYEQFLDALGDYLEHILPGVIYDYEEQLAELNLMENTLN